MLPRGTYFFSLFGRVAPPRPRSVTPVSDSTRCTKPYERPVDSARARMLAPFSYFFFRSVASFSPLRAGDARSLLQIGHSCRPLQIVELPRPGQ